MTEQICTRSVELRADSDSGIVEGIAVPWNSRTTIRDWLGDYEEMFERGSIDPNAQIRLFWQHQDVMGRVLKAEDREEGFWISAQISDTTVGRDARALLKDGAVDSFSVGFVPQEHREEEDGLIVRTKVDLREVSAVTFPAYTAATVSSVRSDVPTPNNPPLEAPMADTATAADLTEVRETVEDLERRMSSFVVRADEPIADTRSAGEIVKAIVSGDEDTIKRYNEVQARAYTGGTLSDSVVKDAWVGDLTRIVTEASPLRSAFSTGTLPATGMNVEYAQLKSDTSTFAVQSKEGDTLAFGKVQIETKTAPVKTYGGYTTLSRQEIERSTVNVLTTALEAQAAAAGKALNAAFRAEYLAEVAAQKTAGNSLAVAANATYAAFLAAIVDAAGKYQDLGLALDGIVAGPATFKRLLAMQGSDGRPVFLVTGQGTNNVGAINPKALTGDIANVTVVLDPKLADGNDAFYNARALRDYASPLVRLSDDNVTTLTKDFSVYSYDAVAHEIPAAIVPFGPAS